ncbi:MAG TPA: cadherin-like beta sandwich domain-containing protein, partial [Haliangium sp.]|nr:cadherin-like beta sandwich domain-containing protein [Haliangium sp.]
DAAPSDFAVRGTATGLLGPVTLELEVDDEVERLTVAEDGAFAFETRLRSGASYSVVFVNRDGTCEVRERLGEITGADAVIELTCLGASLASVVASGIAPAVTLVPGMTDYVVDLPLSRTAVTLTASVAVPGDTLTIAGMPVASGQSSAPIALRLGDNPVDIVVENSLGWRRAYRFNLRRAAQLAEYAHGKASDIGYHDRFGTSVALSGDTLAVGAPEEDSGARGVGGDPDDSSAPSSGAVYVFRRTGTTWQQEAYLKASNTGSLDYFGASVALAGDTLVVGAPEEDSAAQGVGGNQDDDSALESGAVYVFRRDYTEWQQEAYLKASNAGASDKFGHSVALLGDLLAVGAPSEDSAAQGVGGNQDDDSAPGSGAVYVFRREDTVWLQEAYVKASNTGAFDEFGKSVALTYSTLAVGANFEDSAAKGVNGDQGDDSALESGAVYVFRRTGEDWEQEAYLKASNTDVIDHFGISVALSGDVLAVGAWWEDSAAQGVDGDQDDDSADASGAVYVFRRTGTGWQQEAYLKASNAGAEDFFGVSVALAGDTLAVGAEQESSAATGVDGAQDDNSAAHSGAVYVFRRTGTSWQQTAYVKASNTTELHVFGRSVALSDDTLAVGAPDEGSGLEDSGAVYIFH